MLIITAAVCSLLLVAQGQMDDEEWIDPYDMLNYDPSTKTMRKPAEVQYKQLRNACFSCHDSVPLVEIIILLFRVSHQKKPYFDQWVK